MLRLVISTIGTSLLTNQISKRKEPPNTEARLAQTANYKLDHIQAHYPDVSSIIDQLKERAEAKLFDDNTTVEEIREASAELNGIYGLYENQLEKGEKDFHWVIATDTGQGEVTAEIVKEFLQTKGIKCDIYIPKGLSTTNTETFSNGIDDFLKWIDDTIPGYKDNGYEICFNLVGGFKALQGYANTIGMFYADKLIYIFEGSSEVITIPRLPIQVDQSVIKPVEFALMAAGAEVKLSKLENVPETLLFVVGDEATLSNWGKLTWNQCKRNLLSADLLEFPKLVYEQSFLKDYQRKTVTSEKRFELQELLGEISACLTKFKSDTSRLPAKLDYRRYEGGKINHIDHFNFNNNKAWRVSCISKEGKLFLRHFGEHDYVNDNP